MKIATYVRSALAASTLLLAVSALPVTAYADTAFYQVNNVQNDDILNIRSGAGATYPIIGTIPHNGRTVLSTGQTQQNGRSTWAEIVWLGQIGWVNKRFLIDSDQAPQQQVNTPVVVQNNANAHTHPANRCTRSITHTHPNGGGTHKHHYSCDPSTNNAPAPAMKSNYQANLPDPNSHNHPSNECTNSITHTHPNGAGSHQHRYSCDKNSNNAPAPVVKSNYQANLPADPNSHRHPSNECTNSVTHTHPNGAGSHQHRYSCQKNAAPAQQPQPKYRPQPQPKYSNTNDYYAIQ